MALLDARVVEPEYLEDGAPVRIGPRPFKEGEDRKSRLGQDRPLSSRPQALLSQFSTTLPD